MKKFVLLMMVLWSGLAWAGEGAVNADVVRIARNFKDGGHYLLKGSGTPEKITFKRQTILPEGKDGTFCSGFTFNVVMKAAVQRRLLEGKSVEQVKRFQKEWYGATAKSAEVQAGLAMKNLGIGQSIKAEQAQAGDFVQLWREKSGHSVVFLEWVEEDGQKVGFKYRSTQESTDGIGDRIEYFTDAPGKEGRVLRQRTYFARLNPPAERARAQFGRARN